RFDSYLYRTRRARPAPAQAEIDALSSALPSLKQTLERVDTLDPDAQDARRLMSIHLPGLIDRYLHVPAAFRSEQDGEGKTVDERLIEGLAAGRTALGEISEKLARADVAAFETQGRFIKSRYGEERIDSRLISRTVLCTLRKSLGRVGNGNAILGDLAVARARRDSASRT